MARSRSNFAENVFEKVGLNDGYHPGRNESKKQRFYEVKDHNNKVKEKVIASGALHLRARLPVIKSSNRVDPIQETVVTKTPPAENGEEELGRLEKEIETEFNSEEREYVALIISSYPREFLIAKKKLDEKKAKIEDQWVEAFRQSYIGDRVRWGLDKKRWGINGPFAPEKAEIFENYLNLKLPIGIPDAKSKDTQMNEERENEGSFSPEQMAEIRNLREVSSNRFKTWLKESEEWGSEFGNQESRKKLILDNMTEAMSALIQKDPELKKLFSEEEVPEVVATVMKFVKKFNLTIKK